MAEPTEPKPDTSAADGKKPDGNGEGAGTDTAKTQADEKKFTQAELEAQVKERLKRQQEAFEKKQAEEKRLADEAKAKEQGEFQTLAENRQKELDTLKPQLETVTAERDQLKVQVAAIAAAELASLPGEVKDISPAEYAEDKSLINPLVVLAWLPKGKALAEKLDGTPAKPGMGRDPRPRGAPGDGERDSQARSAQANYTRSSF